MHLTNKRGIALFFFFSFWLLLGYYAWYHQDKLHVLLHLPFYSLCILIACTNFGILCRGGINYVFYNRLGAGIKIGQALGLAVLNTLGNQLPFAGGFWAKGLVLKKAFRISLLTYMSATIGLMCFFVALFGLMGLFSLAGLFYNEHVPINRFVVLGFFCMLLPVLPLFLHVNCPALLPARWRDYFKKAVDGWQVLKASPGMLLKLALLQCFGILFYSLRLYVLFLQIEKGIPFFVCLLFASSAILSQFVAVLPAGVGLREGVVSGLGVLLGYDLSSSLLVVSYDRLLDLLITGCWGIFCLLRRPVEQGGREQG